MSDQPVADNKQFSRDTYLYLGGIRTYKPSNQTAVDPRLRPRGSWSRAEPLAQYDRKLWNSKKIFDRSYSLL